MTSQNSKARKTKKLIAGVALLATFAVWTVLIQCIDVQPIGPYGTNVGFATLNAWFHRATGVHMAVYTITDCLSVIPLAICLGFAGMGTVQAFTRKGLRHIDSDILILSAYYASIAAAYLLFEANPINYRPILIDGTMESSYPSSTTLLVLGVMPTIAHQARRRSNNELLTKITSAFAIAFSVLMVVGRLVAGVHWITDIVGSALLASGLFMMHLCAVSLADEHNGLKRKGEHGA